MYVVKQSNGFYTVDSDGVRYSVKNPKKGKWITTQWPEREILIKEKTLKESLNKLKILITNQRIKAN